MTVGMELQPRPDARANMKLGRLGDHVEILSGFAFDSSRFANDGEMPLIRIRDVVRGRTETYYSGQFEGLSFGKATFSLAWTVTSTAKPGRRNLPCSISESAGFRLAIPTSTAGTSTIFSRKR